MTKTPHFKGKQMRHLKRLILALLLISAPAFATEYSKVELRASVNDETATLQDTGTISKYFVRGARQQQAVSLTASAFTALTVPTGAKAMLVETTSLDGVKLKGVTGDTGISVDSTTPILVPVSDDNTTIGFQNMNSTASQIRVYWF